MREFAVSATTARFRTSLKKPGLAPLALALALLLTGCGAASSADSGEPVVVAAAASLGDALEDLRPLARAGGLELIANVAGSNVLALQIEATPAADVFLSANQAWIERLARHGYLRPGTRQTFLSNRLVVIAHDRRAPPLAQLRDLVVRARGNLVLADPRAVPAGRYARSVLEGVTLADGSRAWPLLAPRVVPAADVRAARALVEAQTGSYGIVYATDAENLREAHIVYQVPRALTPDIRYVAAAVAGRRQPARADRFLALITSPEAAAIFARRGFSPPPDA